MSFLSDDRMLLYDFKIVKCGNFLQVYYYKNKKTKSLYKTKSLGINTLKTKTIENDQNIENNIEDRNIIRSKLNCQRLAKANANEWHTFITLTYEKNMQDMKQAKTDLNFFIKNIKKVRKDFKYIAIPEFQKRGAIHFHLLTNLTLQDNYIITKQKSNTKYYDVKYWNKGFTSIEEIKGDIKKIVGYISKYMSKECDDRLFSVRRFTSSQNLVKPVEEFIDTNNINHKEYFKKQLENKECIYSNVYLDKFNNDVIFQEYKIID